MASTTLSTSFSSSEGQEPSFLHFVLSDDVRYEASAWLAGQDMSLDTAFDWSVAEEETYVGMPPLDSAHVLAIYAPNAAVFLGQLSPMEEKPHYLSPDHPDQGYSRMCDAELAPITYKVTGFNLDNLVEEDAMSKELHEARIRASAMKDAYLESVSFDIASAMEAKLSLSEDSESDDEDYDMESDEYELDE
ncbi:hypothetical protein HYPSUDRAFT_51697 [Hypholoma sublateritium FD-334 SS-4]|uniref:Uncharacterized protein n=1 Tax=Hypholoma sublateritium (strain FD-334 SS-4) TaxID=945553 RepID=A0A0D2PA10_HYPSF|nr:hypothetical protein HYPSUDRAFT_51697 [Hypholoma sublateritium FD-334 SS-4]